MHKRVRRALQAIRDGENWTLGRAVSAVCFNSCVYCSHLTLYTFIAPVTHLEPVMTCKYHTHTSCILSVSPVSVFSNAGCLEEGDVAWNHVTGMQGLRLHHVLLCPSDKLSENSPLSHVSSLVPLDTVPPPISCKQNRTTVSRKVLVNFGLENWP